MNEQTKGFLFIILAMLIFGLYGIFIRFLNLSSEIILFFNLFFVAVILFIVFLLKKNNFHIKGHKILIVLLGVGVVGNNLSYFIAFTMTTISNAILTHYTAPIFVAILAPFLIKERLEKITIISLILSFIGIILIAYSGGISLESENFLGILFGITSGVFYAFSIIMYKYLMKNLPVYTLIFYQSLFGSIILSFFVYNQVFLPLQSMLFLLLFALLFGLAATFLHFQGIKRIKAQHAGILGYTEPVAGTIYAFLFFKEIPIMATLIGGVLIILGGYLIIKSGNN